MTVTEVAGVRGIVVACGADQHTIAGLGDQPMIRVPSRPGKPEIDPLLGEYDRLVITGTDADLAAVVVRLLRKDRVSGVSVGFVPTAADSAVAALWRLPADPAEALELALTGDDAAVPLVREDNGGVLVGRATLRDVHGQGYCDETVAFDGTAATIEVSPDAAGIAARVTRGKLLKRSTTLRGRAFQIGCHPTSLVSDGVRHPREVTKWTWYRHIEDLRLVRPAGT
ncbi:hypothetical protein [Amycolatopsis sp. NBC_00345]|uniref:hypothetical protein n=1 Tax=Amycolatopsis sp. NBC_00345 TaxID=2975955 RepID=UPI003FA45430